MSHRSLEVCNKISKAKMGIRTSPNTEFKIGHKTNIGRKCPLETIKKIRLSNLGQKRSPETIEKLRKNAIEQFKKSPHPLWSGGKIDWLKKQTKIKDDYTCQICGLRDPEIMEVDHIKPRSECPDLYAIAENLITLCPNCHRRKTNRYLRERFTKKYYGKHF